MKPPSPDPIRRRLSDWLANLALLVIVSVIGLWLIETYITRTQPIAGAYLHSQDADYLLAPNQQFEFSKPEFSIEIRTNELGMRDDPVDVSAPRRILLLGDSFFFGYGVGRDDMIDVRMEQALNQRSNRRTTVFNAGHSGYDTRREAGWLGLFGSRLKPHIIVVGFVLNDVLSNSGEFHFTPIATGPLRHLPFPATANALTYLIRSPRELLFKLGFDVNYTELDHFDCLRPGRCQAGWSATMREIARIAAEARRLGASVVLANIPVAQMLRRDDSLPAYEPELARQRLSEIARKLDIAFVDFADAPGLGAETSYFPIDGHWNATGHRIAADYLATELQKFGLVE